MRHVSIWASVSMYKPASRDIVMRRNTYFKLNIYLLAVFEL